MTMNIFFLNAKIKKMFKFEIPLFCCPFYVRNSNSCIIMICIILIGIFQRILFKKKLIKNRLTINCLYLYIFGHTLFDPFGPLFFYDGFPIGKKNFVENSYSSTYQGWCEFVWWY